MQLCWSSASHWPQTKVTLFVKSSSSSSSLVLVLGLFLGLNTVTVYTTPVQVHRNSQQQLYCDFTNTGKVYNITDLLICINELASMTIGKRFVRSTNEEISFFPKSLESNEFPQYPPHLQTKNYRNPINLHQDPSYPTNRPGYYKYPPALPPSYPSTSDSSSTPGILGIRLVDALTSISQHDDLKCVLRIICEVATGVIPGSTEYKQSYSSSGMNALISLLTAVDFSDTSPLLNFGKSALMGYANKGNPEVCYRRYSKCPQNLNDVVYYLNNHNGGFFRFFNQRNGYRVNYHNDELSVPYNSVSDRKGTGELKFDVTTPVINLKTLEYHDTTQNEKKIKFPDNQRHFNRLIKSYDYEYENYRQPVTQEKTIFFPQDRMDRNITDEIYYLNPIQSSYEQQNSYNKSKMTEAKLYLIKNNSDQNHKSFTFPDGQSVTIDVGFSKLFNENYKKMLKRGLIMNDVPQPINFEGLSVINLLELYTEDDTQQYIQVIHPCDMICHDSRGTAIQFNQIVNSRGILSTIMTPERPIVDLSQPLPCQVICLSPNGDKKQLSTTINKVLRSNYHHRHHEVDKSTKRFKRALLKNKIIKPRYIGDTYMRRVAKLPYDSNSPQIQKFGLSIDSPSLTSIDNTGGWSGTAFSINNPNVFPLAENLPLTSISSDEDHRQFDGVVIGENPLAYGATIDPQSTKLTSNNGNINPIPATVMMCGSYLYFIPINLQTMPICGTTVNTENNSPTPQILIKPNNQWGNYTNFFAQYGNIDYRDIINDTNFDIQTDSTTVKFENPQDITINPITITPTTLSTVTPITTPAEIFDYEQQSSCLNGESWDTIDRQCVPIKYHKDAEYDYPNEPRYNWDEIPVKKRDEESQKILIMTPDADMYIESI